MMPIPTQSTNTKYKNNLINADKPSLKNTANPTEETEKKNSMCRPLQKSASATEN